MKKAMLPSELYAKSQNAKCEGPWECHWCGSACKHIWMHDEPPRVIGMRSTIFVKKPANPYICAGCWLFRRKSVTINFLSGEYKDRQKICDYSLLMTEDNTFGIRSEDHGLLYEILLQPPLKFCMALLDGEGFKNHIQMMIVNDLSEIKADTAINYTINNIPHTYTVYELKLALRNNNVGVDPGVLALIRKLGSYQLPEKEKRRGRPPLKEEEEREIDKVLVKKLG